MNSDCAVYGETCSKFTCECEKGSGKDCAYGKFCGNTAKCETGNVEKLNGQE